MLGMPSKKELSENDPDKVVRGWNPNEGRRLRAYHYYIQRLDGKTPLWNEMINQLKQDGRNQITGAIFKDDTVVWSDEGICTRKFDTCSKWHRRTERNNRCISKPI